MRIEDLKKFLLFKFVVLCFFLFLVKMFLESKVCVILYMILFLKNRRVFYGFFLFFRYKSLLV